MEPEVLLLDEATDGLDEESKARICTVLRGLPQAMIIVSHERDLVRDLSTRILHMAGGKVVQNG